MPAIKRLLKRRILGCNRRSMPFMRTLRWSFAGAAVEYGKVLGGLTTIAFSQRLAAAARPLPAELSQARCHNDRACGWIPPRRKDAQPDVLEPGISKNPLTDPALRLFGRFRRGRARGGVRIATLSVPRSRAAGSYHRHRLHHLVRRSRAFRAGRSVVFGQFRLSLYRAALLLLHFRQGPAVLLDLPGMGGHCCIVQRGPAPDRG